MDGKKIKILLIDDSGFMRIMLSDRLRQEEGIEIVATASNGLDGVEKVRKFKPNVIITDMVMPQYDGLYVVQEVMKESPVPIILVSSLERGDPKIFDALKEGAFDFVDKPKKDSSREVYQHLCNMIREASMTDYLALRTKVVGRNSFEHSFEAKLNYDIIVLGASTGGPGAIESIINNLPENLPVPVVIAQHMPGPFITSFANRLIESTGRSILIADEGEPLLNNTIYLAPGTKNIKIELSGSCPVFARDPRHFKEFNNPSIDSLFESVARLYGRRAIGVLLSGMGKDGVEGLRKIREQLGLTVTQDQSTSVVYGMPRMAWESGAALHQMSVKDIPAFIISAL